MPASRGRPHGLLATTRASHTELTQAYTDVSGLAHKSFSGKLGVSLEVLASGVDLYMLRMSITGANPAVQLLQLARKPVLEVLKALKAQDPQEDGIEAIVQVLHWRVKARKWTWHKRSCSAYNQPAV